MSFAQKRKSYNDHRMDYLRKQLAKHGNTPEKFWGIFEYWELEPMDAAELSQQVKWGTEAVYSPLNVTPPPYVAVRAGNLDAREPESGEPMQFTVRREMRGPPARLQNLPREPVTVPAGTLIVQSTIAQKMQKVMLDAAKEAGATIIGGDEAVFFSPPKPAPVFRNFNPPPKPAEIPIKDFTKKG